MTRPPGKDAPPGNASVSSAEPSELTEAEVKARLRTLSRRGFAVLGVGAAAAVLGWRWLLRGAAQENGLAGPLRRALETNEGISRDLFSKGPLAATYPRDTAREPKRNGMVGLEDEEFRPETWRLQLQGVAAGDSALDLRALRALPRAEQTTELRCIEGWSTVVHWGGVRFADFARAYPPGTRSGRPFDPDRPGDAPPYVAMETPDGDYYVGLDAESALHPQTLLAWELNGAPLAPEHGAPLRLVIPVKYGIKNIKRIGTIAWGTARPADYWAELGYDWFAGL
jgi:DMSO/TMAO reductase YedYZ molybdopterin-dependent catalytic subunit